MSEIKHKDRVRTPKNQTSLVNTRKSIKQAVKSKNAIRAEQKSFAYAGESAVEKINNSTSKHRAFGYTVIETEGGVKALNPIAETERIKVLKIEGGKITFCIRTKHLAQIIAILDDLCYNYLILGERGFYPTVLSIVKRFGLILGVAVATLALVLYSQTVLHIEGVDDGRVLDVLARHGVKVGCVLFDFDADLAERDILALDGVAYAKVRRIGTRVCVDVRAENPLDNHLTFDCGIKAKCPAKVSRIIVFGGTAEVSVGDEVQDGDTLIGGYYLYGDEKISAPASGIVYGITDATVTKYYPDVVVSSEVCEKTVFVGLGFLGKTPSAPSSSYKDYVVALSVEKNEFLIPFCVYRWEYGEVRTIERVNSLTDSQMVDKVVADYLQGLPFDATLKSVTSAVTACEGGRNVTVQLTIEEIITT